MKQKFIEKKCPICNNDFAYQEEEIIIEEDKKFVICPICGNKIEISSDTV